ncbi:uncharacterized protein LOC127080871 [Lathyrus oleraceus]|uniref:uncharacterized protein LOC127080871 n=1 Tax=Pisum sativum TaxID=3888 RepID=UPI0021D0DEEA|nr:uncharacterized protein LOC127080871 [Pisum sativum]
MNPERRITFQYKYKKVALNSLKKLSAKVIKLTEFVDDYGRILAPTLEEFEITLGQNLRDHDSFPKIDEGITAKRIASILGMDVQLVISNWDKKGVFNGFSRWFLEEQVVKLEKAGKGKAFHVILALLVYGIVLFLNLDNFVVHVAIKIFLFGNPIPFILCDIYYALHEHHEKKGGTHLCGKMLLHAWFRYHMPENGPYTSKTIKLSLNLASLATSHVKWYIRDWETPNIIVSIEDFPNVLLIWTRGCINYNHMLCMMQHGYSMNEPPKVEALEPFIFHDIDADNPIVKKIKKSWKTIVRRGKEFGNKNVLVKEPYTHRLNAKIKELKLKKSDLRLKLNQATLENENLKDERQEKDRDLEAINKRARTLEDKKDELDDILIGKKSVFKTKNEELKKAHLKIQELDKLLERSLVEKREVRLDYEAQICKIRDNLKKCKGKLSREGVYREDRVSLDEDQHVIKKLLDLYVEWNGKFFNLARFANLNMLELPEKLQEVDWSMCPENRPPQVFNFVKFFKRMVKELTIDLATIKRAEMEIKFMCT